MTIILFQDVFNERVKIFKNWKEAEATLAKKREAKAKLELARKMDKIAGASQEITEVNTKFSTSAARANIIHCRTFACCAHARG